MSFLASNEHPILSRKSRHLCPLNYVFATFGLHDTDCSEAEDGLGLNSPAPTDQWLSGSIDSDLLPGRAEVQHTIQALVESSKHGPSNIDKIISLSQLQEDCGLVYGPGGISAPQLAASRFRCFITVYLAKCMTGAVNAEDISTDPRASSCLSIGLKELAVLTKKSDFVSQSCFVLCSSDH